MVIKISGGIDNVEYEFDGIERGVAIKEYDRSVDVVDAFDFYMQLKNCRIDAGIMVAPSFNHDVKKISYVRGFLDPAHYIEVSYIENKKE